MNGQPRAWTAAESAAGRKLAAAWQSFFRVTGEAPIERAAEINALAKIAEVQGKHEAELLRLGNAVGVAAMPKVKSGKPTRQWSLTVLVEKKVPESKLAKAAIVPATVAGVPTDVLEVGKLEALVFNARVRPALPGFSIGHHDITAGTFGCLVQDIRRCCTKPESHETPSPPDRPDDYLILSNNHVLANVNRAKPGDLILQPGPFDGGEYPADGIATLDRFEPIVFGGSGYNLVDAAVARPSFSRNVTASIIGVLMPRGVNQVFPGSPVIKAGRTTQVTTGVVLAANATVNVGYGAAGVAQFRHQILTTAMSAGGDSGSLLMDSGLAAVGLLFAGSAIITVHNHIGDVEAALGVRPLTAPR